MDKIQKQGSRIAELIDKGREQGYLTYADVNDHLPEDISDPDQVDEIIGMINDLGLQVHETAPDADTLMLSESSDDDDDIALEQAAEALAAVENETGRTTDPVRMYMREMGTVDLLTREGEIEIAKRIEEGMRDLLAAARRSLMPSSILFAISISPSRVKRSTVPISLMYIRTGSVVLPVSFSTAARASAACSKAISSSSSEDSESIKVSASGAVS